MNGQVEVTCRTLRTTAHSIMVHFIVLEAYNYFTLMYMADHIFQVLTIKNLINKYREPTTPYKLVTGMKPSIFHLHVLFCPCVVQKSTTHVETKTLNIHHQAQNIFAVA